VASVRYKPQRIDVVAIVLLLVGGLIVPLVGWVVGVVLLWVSDAWKVRDKVIGTVFLPGGLGLTGFIVLLAGLTGDSSSGSSASSTNIVDALVMSIFLFIIVVPIITTAYLTYRLLRRPVAATA
jgi:hypothetical protein